MGFSNEMTLAEARKEMDEQLVAGDMLTCPCCDQTCYIYTRQVDSRMARHLIIAYKKVGVGQWFRLSKVIEEHQGDWAKMSYWGLIEMMDGLREDGSRRNGMWRITPKGEDYIRGAITIPKHVRIYNKEWINFVGDQVTIYDALSTKFSYRELMAA